VVLYNNVCYNSSMKRNTVQKQLIMAAVKELDIHANAGEVYEFVTKNNPSISKATVYRNLSQMAKDGELLNIGTFSGVVHYDHNTHEHAHFVCNNCGVVFDVDCDIEAVNKIKDNIAISSEYTITSYNLSFGGICKKCEQLQKV